VAILYRIFGFHEFIGRLVSIFFGLGTMIFIYLLTKKYFAETAALSAAAFFAFSPMAVYYNRAFMPESAMLFFSISGMYFLMKWLDNNKIVDYILSAILLSLAILIKATSLYLFIPIVYLFVRRKFSPFCWLYIFLVLVGPFLWYYYQHQIYKSFVGGPSIWDIGTDKWFNRAILLNPDFYQRIWLQHLGELHLAYSGYIFLIIGFLTALQEENKKVFGIWLLAVFFYFIVVAVGNYVHEYYQLPVLLVGSILVGAGISRSIEKIKNISFRTHKIILTVGLAVLLLWLPIYGYTKSGERMRFDYNYKIAGEHLARISLPDDKIIVVSDGEPEVLYYSKRKGWHFNIGSFSEEEIKAGIEKGAKYLVILPPEKKVNKNFKLVVLPEFGSAEKLIINYLQKRYKPMVKTNSLVIYSLIKTNARE